MRQVPMQKQMISLQMATDISSPFVWNKYFSFLFNIIFYLLTKQNFGAYSIHSCLAGNFFHPAQTELVYLFCSLDGKLTFLSTFIPRVSPHQYLSLSYPLSIQFHLAITIIFGCSYSNAFSCLVSTPIAYSFLHQKNPQNYRITKVGKGLQDHLF